MRANKPPERREQISPIDKAIPAARQQFARHYGVHPYFTRRPANVVREYIEHYSRIGDTVLDPFGGSGVTAIEAMLLGRYAIHNDLNPFANFITASIADTSLSLESLHDAFHRIEKDAAPRLSALEAGSDRAVARLLSQVPLPKNIRLPRSSDAERFFDLFTPRQLAALAVLKQAIEAESNKACRNALLLAWSASAAKLNRTFLSAKGRAESRGGSSIFSIYRYKLAKKSVELPAWETFKGRYLNVVRGKAEVLQAFEHYRQIHPHSFFSSASHLRILSHDASSISKILKSESVDYIFTDPPYGAHIAYLDLSILWNHWLGYDVDEQVRKGEAIVGGELRHSDDHYRKKLEGSIRECARMLRPGRWFSLVFQHWDPAYFSSILETAEECALELKAAVTHEQEVIWSMHKKKNSESVLAGEMILSFYKPEAGGVVSDGRKAYASESTSFMMLLDRVLQGSLHGRTNFTSEFIFNQLVLQAWKDKSLNVLSVPRQKFADALRQRGWNYDERIHEWTKGKEIDRQQLLFDN